jgi:hypothetical protein
MELELRLCFTLKTLLPTAWTVRFWIVSLITLPEGLRIALKDEAGGRENPPTIIIRAKESVGLGAVEQTLGGCRKLPAENQGQGGV